MIIGVGVDLCAISRIAAAIERHEGRFEERLFTPAEREYCRMRSSPAQHFAARFAAKEACVKALGAPAGLAWHELEVVRVGDGRPRLMLSGASTEIARGLGVERLHLTMSHQANFAVAVVVAERDEGERERAFGVRRGGR
ncbi:holo-ACP synthase [Sorangium sp. So ce124]|uniref:holo-ACP synthase n=1 Tax=Sorangium sp. So ce124 TaxID=3133280 RepID=UPI003F623E88